ncbi:MAG: DUF4258 domain-containing protein [Candidatus Brocadiia bacterium]|jgi:hypothetical protein
MGRLFDRVRKLVADEKYIVGEHAVERLEERGFLEWQVVSGVAEGRLLLERPDGKPNPAVEILVVLPDGTEVKAVWALLAQSGVAKLVTVHFIEEGDK